MRTEIKPLLTAILFFGLITLLAYSLTAQIVHRQPITQKMESYINPFNEEVEKLEDCIEWLDEDMHNGTVSKESGSLYISNLVEVIKVLKNTPSMTYKQYQYNKKEIIAIETK